MITDEFNAPGPAYRGKPFWSWNGKLDEKELKRQIDIFKAMGMGGYFCHSRTGLETAYLGEEWFRLINVCADYGTSLGMETWLYDEDRWPSGTAGGMVTANPEFRMKFLRMSPVAAESYTERPEHLAAFSVCLSGNTFTKDKRLFRGERPSGDTVLVFTVEEMEKSSVYNGYTYVDTMNREATDAFINITHEQYQSHCGERMGTGIRGIFTDEPHRGALMNGFGITNPDAAYLVPYTQDLFSEFKKRFGYSLEDNLPELYLFRVGQSLSPVKYHVVELLQQLYIERYLQPIYTWCRNHHIELTGHMLQEDTLTAQVCMTGSVMRMYEFMDIPGVDVLTEKNDCYWLMKQVQSVARQQGKPCILTELYGCTSWRMTFETYKSVGDWQALFGANMRCHHLAWYSMQGDAKRDYPASIFFQSDWHRYYRYVEDYFSRLHLFMEQGTPVCSVLVLNPVETLWGRIYPGWAAFLEPAQDENKQLEEQFKDIFHILCDAQIDFDYGEEEHLSRMAYVKDGWLHLGKTRYQTVLGFGMKTMRASTLRLLREMKATGGRVVFAGELPGYVDALPSTCPAEQLSECQVPFDASAILRALHTAPPLTVLEYATGKPTANIYLQARQTSAETSFMLLNMDRENSCTVTIFCEEDGCLECWDARTGTASLFTRNAQLPTVYTFPPDGELLLVLTQTDHGYDLLPHLQEKSAAVLETNHFSYRLTEPNVCVLDRAHCYMGGKDTLPEMEILRVDQALRTRHHLPLRGSEMVQPWCDGAKQDSALEEITLSFDFEVEAIPDSIQLAMETPEQFTADLNGQKALTPVPDAFWIDPCFKLYQVDTAALRVGGNTLNLRTGFGKSSNLEAVYLLGAFGVQLKGARAVLTELPPVLAVGDIVQQGFPFYGAGVVYSLPPCPSCEEGQRLFIDVSGMDGACFVVNCQQCSGDDGRIIAFSPFTTDITDFQKKPLELECVLTRRNTFGPLHELPADASICAPMNFYTQGSAYLKNGYSLVPQGMTQALTYHIVQG